jgi:hypothetical protein
VEGLAEYAGTIRAVDWYRIWKYEEEEWKKMK